MFFSPGVLALFFTVLVASVVEMVEALTIVLAIGLTRGWRSTFIGSAAAVICLAALTAVLGPLLILIPITVLHLVVGCVLLIFGLQWLRKAILRAGGFLPLHDEDAIYDRQISKAKAEQTGKAEKVDWYAFTIVFKGVFLEGLEVIFIVLTFGASQHNIPVAALAALIGVLVVGLAGIVVHRPLAKIPENTLKFIVGIMLTCFGIFWGGSGAGIHWPGGNGAIFGLVGFMLVVSLGSVALLRQIADPKLTGRA